MIITGKNAAITSLSMNRAGDSSSMRVVLVSMLNKLIVPQTGGGLVGSMSKCVFLLFLFCYSRYDIVVAVPTVVLS